MSLSCCTIDYICITNIEKKQRVLTGGTDAVSVQDVVPPYWFTGSSVQHGPHHLVKGLVGVTPQNALCVFVDKAATKSWEEKNIQDHRFWHLPAHSLKCWRVNLGLRKRFRTLVDCKEDWESHLCPARLCWGPERPQYHSRCNSSRPRWRSDPPAASQSQSARWFWFWPLASEDRPAGTSEYRCGSSGCSQ